MNFWKYCEEISKWLGESVVVANIDYIYYDMYMKNREVEDVVDALDVPERPKRPKKRRI